MDHLLSELPFWGGNAFGLFSAHNLQQFGRLGLSWILLFITLNLGLFFMIGPLQKDEFRMLQNHIYCCLRPGVTQLCKGALRLPHLALYDIGASFSIWRRSTRMSSMHGSKYQDFPLRQADELCNTGTSTYQTGKFESSCGCFPKQNMKEYSA